MKKDNLKLKILIGIPASGKSTWCVEFLRNHSDWVRVNRDSFRLMLRNEQICEPKVEDLISTLVNKTIHAALMKKLNVIVDATNVKVKYVEEFIEEFKYDADIEYQVFDISLDKAIERDNNRAAKVGELVIKRMYKDFQIFMDTFHFQPVNKIERRPLIQPNYESNLPDAVIFDIDGTIALMGDRGPYDMDKVYKDNLNHIVAEQISFHTSLGRKIIYLSGRDESCREQTEEWLTDIYGLEEPIYFFMRKENDFRKDSIIKKEIYDEHIKGKFNIIAAYDDRLQVLDMWYKEGIFTFNVNQGNIEF
jgi:predicted kinase